MLHRRLPDRLDPRSITPAATARLLETLPPDAELARALVSAYHGISPVMAHEIVFQATGSSETRAGDVNAECAEPLARETLALLEPLRTTVWSPQIYRERGHADPGEVVACSPILMTHLAAEYDVSSVESMSEALAQAESAADRPSPARHAQRRQRLLDSVAAAREKAERRLAALATESARAAEAERLKNRGRVDLRLSLADRARPGLAGRRRHIDPARSRSDRERERPGLLRALPQGPERGGATAGLGRGESRGDRLSRSAGDIDRAGAGIFRVGGPGRGVGGASGAGSCSTAKEDDRRAPAAGARRRQWEQRLRRPQRPSERARHLRHRGSGRHLAARARRRRLARGDPLAIP